MYTYSSHNKKRHEKYWRYGFFPEDAGEPERAGGTRCTYKGQAVCHHAGEAVQHEAEVCEVHDRVDGVP